MKRLWLAWKRYKARQDARIYAQLASALQDRLTHEQILERMEQVRGDIRYNEQILERMEQVRGDIRYKRMEDILQFALDHPRHP